MGWADACLKLVLFARSLANGLAVGLIFLRGDSAFRRLGAWVMQAFWVSGLRDCWVFGLRWKSGALARASVAARVQRKRSVGV